MRSFRIVRAALVAALVPATHAEAQQRTPPGWHETQLWVAALASKPAVGALGLGLAWRDAGRTRVGVSLGGGIAEGRHAAGRLELAWHFLLDPGQRKKVSFYGGGGVAVQVIQGDRVRPWVQLALGMESAPAGSSGWFIEGGFGGGARIAAGVRWRRRAQS